jgi:hypothetical protein
MTSPWQLINATTGETVVTDLEIADTFWSRFKGLQLRAGLPPGSGLLLVPCPGVHTFFMRFAIDVVVLDREGRVIAVRQQVRPWRIVPPVSGGYAVLELPAGTAKMEVGGRLRLRSQGSNEVRPPPSIQFLL